MACGCWWCCVCANFSAEVLVMWGCFCRSLCCVAGLLWVRVCDLYVFVVLLCDLAMCGTCSVSVLAGVCSCVLYMLFCVL